MKRKIAAVLAAFAAIAATGCDNNNISDEKHSSQENSNAVEADEFCSDEETEPFYEEETDTQIQKPVRTHENNESETTVHDADEDEESFDDEKITDNTADEEHGKLKCIWYVDGIALIMDGNEVQKIEMWDDIPSASEVEIADFNNDGYEDVSIPQYNNPSYWIYNPYSKKFDVTYDLNSIKQNSEDRQ